MNEYKTSINVKNKNHHSMKICTGKSQEKLKYHKQKLAQRNQIMYRTGKQNQN